MKILTNLLIFFSLLFSICVEGQKKEIRSEAGFPDLKFSTSLLKYGQPDSTDKWINQYSLIELNHIDSILKNYSIKNSSFSFELAFERLCLNLINKNWNSLEQTDTMLLNNFEPKDFKKVGPIEFEAFAKTAQTNSSDFARTYRSILDSIMTPLSDSEKIKFNGLMKEYLKESSQYFDNYLDNLSEANEISDTSTIFFFEVIAYNKMAEKVGQVFQFTFYNSINQSKADGAIMDSILNKIDGITILKKTSHSPYYSIQYVLNVRQPLDHNDSSKGYFEQQVILSHKGFSNPMVMVTDGYEGRRDENEIDKILDANDINIEHRYFGKSRPDSLNLNYLTFEQVVSDLHHIRQLFGEIYKNKWISTGYSRSGQIALYYKTFYPKDVDATIAYVTALPNSLEDPRINAFLDTAGSITCRKKMKGFQIYMLEHEREILQKLPELTKGMNFQIIGGLGKAYEISILEYPFSFWQITNLLEKDIPSLNSLDSCISHLFEVSSLEWESDATLNKWFAHYYMALTQMGYYGYKLKPFEEYLHYLKGPDICAAFVSPAIPVKPYDAGFEKKVHNWLNKSGNNIIYINGRRDTWSACKIEVGPGLNSKSFIIPGSNHYLSNIINMPPVMQQEFVMKLKEMTGLHANLSALN